MILLRLTAAWRAFLDPGQAFEHGYLAGIRDHPKIAAGLRKGA